MQPSPEAFCSDAEWFTLLELLRDLDYLKEIRTFVLKQNHKPANPWWDFQCVYMRPKGAVTKICSPASHVTQNLLI